MKAFKRTLLGVERVKQGEKLCAYRNELNIVVELTIKLCISNVKASRRALSLLLVWGTNVKRNV